MHLSSSTIRGFALAIAILAFGTPSVEGAVTIERRSSAVLYVDPSDPQVLSAGYVAYAITNTGPAIPSATVTIDGFSGGVISLAANETGIVQLQGALASGKPKTAFFYLQASAATTAPQSHTVSVRRGGPGGPLLASQTFTMTSAQTIAANANKVHTFLVIPSSLSPGDKGRIVVSGTTGVIGAAHVLSFTPAAAPGWPANALRITGSRIELSASAGSPYLDTLLIPPGSVSSTDHSYTATYYFDVLSAPASPVHASPIAFASSGVSVKHTSTDNFGGFVVPIANPTPTPTPSTTSTPTATPTQTPTPTPTPTAPGSVTLTRRSSPVLYVASAENPVLQGAYAAYGVTNDTNAPISPVFVTISGFTGPQVSAAQNENGVVEIVGGLGPNETKTVYFYLQAGGPTSADESHTVAAFGAVPPDVPLGSASFDLAAVETIKASANKVDTVLTVPDPILAGVEMTLTVAGHTGTVGPNRIMAFTPAALTSWPASDLRLTSASIALPGFANTPYNDLLLIPQADVTGSDTAYTATYRFTVVSLPSASFVPIAPVAIVTNAVSNIEKHTDPSNFGGFHVPLPSPTPVP